MVKRAMRVLVFLGFPFLMVWQVLAVETALGQPEIEASLVFQKGDFYGYRIPSLVVTKIGTILAFAERRVGLHDHAQNDIVLKRSSDGGWMWGPEIIVHEDGKNVLVNPCSVVLESGRILMMYQWFKEGYHARSGPHMKLLEPGLTGEKVSHTLITFSDNDGVTWSRPRDVTAGTKRAEVNSTATGPGIGIVLRRGKHRGRIIMPTNEGWWEGKNRYFSIYVAYSDDEGATWRYGESVPPGDVGYGNECQVVELSDGTLLFNSRSFSGNHFRKVSRSTDGGQTWSPLVDDKTLIEPECMGSILRYSFPESGKSVVLFANPASQSARELGTVRISYDEGRTWPLSKLIVPGAYAYSCLTRLPDGNIGLLYEAEEYNSIRFVRFGLNWLESGE
jgi:sialidase-1